MAMIAEAFVSKLCEILLTYAKEDATKILGVPDEIKKLHWRLTMIQASLADAENRRFDNVAAINIWLNQLRDLMYDADDTIDEWWIEAEKLLSSSSSSSRCVELVRCCSCPPIANYLHKVRFHHKIGNRIRDINRRLDELAKDKAFLNLAPAPHHHDLYRPSARISYGTSPVVEPELVGEKIETDMRILVDLLIKEHKKRIPIFAIVGMGGIGKTTLAQKIYNDEKLRDNFNQMPRIWLYVSQDFSVSELLRSIITQAGGGPGENKEKEVLEPMLSQVITNKKFFLILDDVWDARVWDEVLRKPLQSGLADGRILITTRNKSIAEQMGATYIHMVEKLSPEDGWSLICKMVFEEGDEQHMHVLSDVGMKIVEKCDGLPLALRTVGGVLRTKAKRQSEWEKVLAIQAWSFTKLPNDERGRLSLSYVDLPPPLKQCFPWFSLLSEDYIIVRFHFVQICIAEGFVTSEDNMALEDVAEGYWKELVQRSLLQPDPASYDEYGCRMHDLLRSLARHIARDECFIGDAQALERKIKESSSSSSSPSIKLRRLSLVDEKLETIPDLIMEQTSLRTLLFFRTPLIHDVPVDLFRKLTSLRVLDLGETTINILPTSLGDLVHLRSLDLHLTPITEIPESIGNLRNLQFLILDNCEYLHNLPSGVLRLISLRSLEVRYTPLDGLPMGIGGLQQLHSIFGFVVNGSEGGGSGAGDDGKRRRFCTLEDLKSLGELKGLTIHKLERVSNRDEARAAALEAKPHLLFLEMYCTLTSSSSSDVRQPPRANDYEEEAIKRIGEVFEELCPPPCLENLVINGYFGLEFPSWMTSSLRNLRRLVLKDCARCRQLPPLGMLPQLDYLWIEGASAITSIGREFLLQVGSCFSPCFPKQLHIDRCPKLRSLLESLLCRVTALKRLYIIGAHSLREIQNLPSLTELIVEDNSSLERLSNFPALKYLDVEACKELMYVEGVDAVEHIRLLDQEAEFPLPMWLVGAGDQEQGRFPSLHKLTLKNKICRRGLPDWPPISC